MRKMHLKNDMCTFPRVDKIVKLNKSNKAAHKKDELEKRNLGISNLQIGIFPNHLIRRADGS